MADAFLPANHQAPLPVERLILKDGAEGAGDRMELDVIIVGAGPAGLACAIELAKLGKAGGVPMNIGVLEKAEALGEHTLSGAVVNRKPFRELFPHLKDLDFPFHGKVKKEAVYLLTADGSWRLPTPQTMHNRGHYIASISEIVRWLGAKAEEAGVNIFTGFPAASLLTKGSAVVGVRTAPSGLDRDGNPGPGSAAPNDITAKVTALAEGTRGPLAQAWCQWQGVSSLNPQIFALGVKELWETKVPLDRVIHTLGWPLPNDVFGGSFIYPLEPNLVALGLVVGLDYEDAGLDVHGLLQRLKRHPLVRPYLEGGDLVEWGAKTIPEGGFYSLPNRFSGDGVVLLGDTAGFVDVPSLKGIHYAMQSGIYAARAIFPAVKMADPAARRLAEYDRLVTHSYVGRDLYRTRNMRLAFKDGLVAGGLQAALMTLTRGLFPGWRYTIRADAAKVRRPIPGAGSVEPPDGRLTFSKVDAVFKSGNATRDTIPTHLIVGKEITEEVARFYAHVCPAGVYEATDGGLRINAPNCVDCKATDILGPRWTPREGGSGPKYKRM
jgi:electron-transferring-flavoprotein dehydrogenase